MKDRIHLVVREEEKERYRASAERAGLSLSEWLREAARLKLASRGGRPRLDSVDDLRDFFARCDARHEGEGPEPGWEDQKRLISASMRTGNAGAGEA